MSQGRIYRIVDDARPRKAEKLAGKPSTPELAARLNHPNGFWRDRAQQMLVERRDLDVVPLLRKQAELADNSSPLGRLHASWTLDGLGQIDLPTLGRALDDPMPKVRSAAIRLAEQSPDRGPR